MFTYRLDTLSSIVYTEHYERTADAKTKVVFVLIADCTESRACMKLLCDGRGIQYVQERPCKLGGCTCRASLCIMFSVEQQVISALGLKAQAPA
jgi:hypothetical protein